MKKPGVFYLSTSLNLGGTEKFLLTLAKNLSADYEISAGVLRKGGQLEEPLREAGIKVTRCTMPWEIAGYLGKNKIDIIHTFLFWGHIFGRIGAGLAKTPSVITTQQAVDVWKKPYHTFLDKITAPLCDVFIANSLAAAKRLENFEKVPAGKIRVVYNGIDPSEFKAARSREEIRKELNIPEGSFVAACISRLHYDKGVDFLPDIASKTPGCIFLVAGDGPMKGLLTGRIKSMNLESRFVLCGWRHDVADLLGASDAFILPSREESFPQAALEAMAMKLPVIVADVGGVRELVEAGVNGLLLKPGDIEGFASAINKLLNDGTLRLGMSRASLERSAQFGEDKMIKSVAGIYGELLLKRSLKTPDNL